jgi:hypothetical protein
MLQHGNPDPRAYCRSLAEEGNEEYGAFYVASTVRTTATLDCVFADTQQAVLADNVKTLELQHLQARIEARCPNLLRIISNSPNSEQALAELADLVSNIQNAREELKEETRKKELIEGRVRQVLEKLAEKKSQVAQLQKEKTTLEQLNTSLKETGESLMRKLTVALDRFKSTAIQLKQEEPLVKIGAAVRLRFLEKAAPNAVTWANTYADRDYHARAAIIEAGNAAGHQGNMEADMALFKCGLVDAKEAAEKFKAIYYWKHDVEWFPHTYRTAVSKWNVMATLRSSADLRRIATTSDDFGVSAFLDDILKLYAEIRSLQPCDIDWRRYDHAKEDSLELGTRDFFEDPVVEEKVAELRALVEKVVKKVWRKASV